MGAWRYKAGLFVLAVFSAAVVVTVCFHFGALLFYSPLAIVAVIAAGLLAGAALAGMFLPGARLHKIVAAVSHLGRRIADTPVPTHVGGTTWLFAVAALAFAVLTVRYERLNISPAHDDQMAFLRLAEQVKQTGGPVTLLLGLWQGKFREANRHPLYVALLSLNPTFEAGKRTSLLIGSCGLVILTWLVGRHFGRPAAALFAVFLATNAAFCRLTTRVVCDSLLLILAGTAWWVAERCITRERDVGGLCKELSLPGRGDRSKLGRGETLKQRAGVRLKPRTRRWWTWGLLGALLGLCYLTKGTGLLLLLGALAWGVWESITRLRCFSQAVTDGMGEEGSSEQAAVAGGKAGRGACVGPTWARTRFGRIALLLELLVMLVAWLAVASPLIVRNLRVYGSPFYNVNTQLLFEDRFLSPVQLAASRSLQQAVRQYLKQHSMSEMLVREVSGLAWEAFIVLRSLGPAPWEDARVLPGSLLFLLACLGLFSHPAGARRLVVLWLVIFWVVFAWYIPIAAGDRFVLPLVPALTAYASVGLLRALGWAERLQRGRPRDTKEMLASTRRVARTVLAVGVSWAALAMIATWIS